MTAVLSATDALRHDKIHAHDDNHYSSTDWRAKYLEVADMLAETRAELEDFQQSSKELEEELEQELERTEKAQQDLKIKASKAETERDEWKSKFMSLQTTHNTTTTSLQRELDQLRQEQQKVKIQLRELEMGNDNLERNERAIASSLVDIESKYTRALEEKILLEHELLDKANLEEEFQRLKDELRDANEEIAILKDHLSNKDSHFQPVDETSSKAVSRPSTSSHSSNEELLRTEPPPDLQLSDLSPEIPSQSPPKASIRPTSLTSASQASLLQRTLQPPRSHLPTPPNASKSSLARSSTLPSMSPIPIRNLRTPAPRPITARNVSTVSTTSTIPSTSTAASKSKGVQMVSEMRARVKNLEQRIHTRVPRLRMGSISKQDAPSMSTTPYNPSSVASSTSTTTLGTLDDLGSTIRSKKRTELVKEVRKTPRDTSGWVLIMEDSPSPLKDKEKELRRTSSPPAPSAFRLPQPVYPSSSSGGNIRSSSALSQSVIFTGIRRPQSRLSDGRTSTSTTASTASSIPTSISRPSTPTFLPVPSTSLYASTTGGKRSTGLHSVLQLKRPSLGSESPPLTIPPSPEDPNVTIRRRLPGSKTLSKSRIGKPSGRRSTGADSLKADELTSSGELGRTRSGSTSAF